MSNPSGIRSTPCPIDRLAANRTVAVLLFVGCILASTVAVTSAADNEPQEQLTAWRWIRPIQVPAEADSPWIDFLVIPAIFTHLQSDLDDLRIHDATGREIPYALRVRREEDSTEDLPGEIFNRAVGPENSRELSLDLGEEQNQHNEVKLEMPGENFRRRATLEGSPDGERWGTLTEENLIRFVRGDERLDDLSLDYPPSRFRYLRLRVFQDPAVDEEIVEIDEVTVRRRIAVPGEDLELRARLDPREPTRESGAPASAWTIHLGGKNVPVSRIEVQFAEQEFVRDYVVRYAGTPDPFVRFHTVAQGTWRRRQGRRQKEWIAEFDEVRADQLRLVVIDHSNPPLSVEAVRYAAPARQVVLPRPGDDTAGLRLYYGNPDAIAPQYDFGRNLPPRLDPPPGRTQLGPPRQNPDYIPPRLPVTERWPWMIYVVLGAVSVILAGVIVSVARTTIAIHDGEAGDGESPQPAHGAQ